MAKDVRTDALIGDACPLAQTSKELCHAISRQMHFVGQMTMIVGCFLVLLIA
jgi:hypothetical protein